MVSVSSVLGAAAEHLVVCELLRRGYIAGLAPMGAPNTDIIVTDLVGARLCSIQVKARRDIGADKGWHMKSKHEKAYGKHYFYCFVDFGKHLSDVPKIYIVPSDVVAEILRVSYQDWLSKPGAKGQQRNDNVMRRLLLDYSKQFGEGSKFSAGWLEKYRNAWSVLGLEPVIKELEVNH